MSEYIMILLIFGSGNSLTSSTAEFASKAACEAGLAAFFGKFDGTAKSNSWVNYSTRVHGICVPKALP